MGASRRGVAVLAAGAALIWTVLNGEPVTASSVAFSAPVMVNPPEGEGYEPSIKVDSAGTIFITAHKNSLVAEGGQLNSWLWRSENGSRFERMPGGELFYSLEGDFAIDAKDRLYFADTYLGDSHIASWTDHGRKLETYRPYTATLTVDDRPWLTAHHDGLVYLLVNNGYTPDGRLEIFRSTDHGATFEPEGFLFPRSGYGTSAADPRGDHVYVAMNDNDGLGSLTDHPASTLTVWVSPDRGETWRETTVAPYEYTDPDGYPVVSVDAAGNVFVLWADGALDSRPAPNGSRLKLSRSTDHGETWETFDITPPELRYNDLFWLAADPTIPGLLGIGWNASTAEIRPTISQGLLGGPMEWSLNAGIIMNAQSGIPSLSWRTVDPFVIRGGAPPQDFLQVAFSPDHRLNLAWSVFRPRSGTGLCRSFQDPTDACFSDIYFARQTAGPNLVTTEPPCKAKNPPWSNGKPKCKRD